MTAQSVEPAAIGSQVAEATDARGIAGAMEVIVEVPVAIVFNGTTAAVMMATPSDLRDLAYGFAITEGYVHDASEIESFEVVGHGKGVEARLWVVEHRAEALAARRRAMAGPVGCGLCGIESLEEAVKPVVPVPAALELSAAQVIEAMAGLQAWQPLKAATRSAHAAGLYVPGRGIVAAREDVGRHNALDKLVGHAIATGTDCSRAAVVVSSRVSVELIQKCARLGAPVLIAPSGPTSLAVDVAREARLTLFGFCRGGTFQRFT